MKLVEENIIIVVGDLGAGANFVKNTLLLSPSVDFPDAVGQRLQYICSLVYPPMLKNNLNKWISQEYRLRFWQQYYGVDIADYYNDINTPQLISASQHNKIVFLSHWPDTALKLKDLYPGIKLVSLYPANENELRWQINAYIEKLGIQRLQNFTFLNDIEQQKNNYINNHGADAYYKLNVLNMFEILRDRINDYKNLPGYNLSIGRLQRNDWATDLSKWLNIDIDPDQATALFETWHNLQPHSTENYWLTNNDKSN